MQQSNIYTRRDFIKKGVVGSAMSWTIPSFLNVTLQELQAANESSLLQSPTGKNDSVLVVLQLAGGNDGLNTVVPFDNEYYQEARPTLAIKADDTLKLNDECGFNPSLKGFKSLYDEGQLAIIQGVGYPNPNRSHFRSMEIWHTATDSNVIGKHGWIGRYFDNQCKGVDPSAGISIGKEPPQAFYGKTQSGITFQQARQYRYAGLDGPVDAEDEFYKEMNVEGDSITSLGSRKQNNKNPLDFLERTALDAQLTSDEIQRITRKKYTSENYPRSRIGNDLKVVAQLIAGGLPTRIYYVSHGGFDTHANQKNSHAQRLSEAGDAVKAFLDDMKKQGNEQRILVMLFSEFGRRVKENGSKGTDHGVAGPMFLAGGNLKAGIHGKLPSLAPEDLYKGDIVHSIDFRSIYASVLEKHLKAPSRPILRKPFPLMDIFA